MGAMDDDQLTAIIKLSNKILAAKVELAAAETALVNVLAGNLNRGAVPVAGKRRGRPPGSKNKKKTPAAAKEQLARARKKAGRAPAMSEG